MPLEVADQVGGQLPGTVECRLAPAQGFVEFGLAVVAEVGYLCGGQGADFPTAAGVGRRGLEGQECGYWSRSSGWRGFVIEVGADVVGLQGGGAEVGGQEWEVDVIKGEGADYHGLCAKHIGRMKVLHYATCLEDTMG